MKAVILAGGLGTRLSEETSLVPKPMVHIGSHPILWHIMKTYYASGVRDFIILAGYKSEAILSYFANYGLMRSDITKFEFVNGIWKTHTNSQAVAEDWSITVMNTGTDTQTGGRLLRASHLLQHEESFFFTYGDGLTASNVNSVETVRRDCNVIAALSAVLPPSRYGALKFDDPASKRVSEFVEKPLAGEGYINGGYMSLTPKVFDFLDSDQTNFEAETLPRLANKNQLVAHKHDGFWMSMDTLRDKVALTNLEASGEAPWKIW